MALLFTGGLLKKLKKAVQILEDHMMNEQACVDCYKAYNDKIIKTCDSCQKMKVTNKRIKEIHLYDIESFR